MLCVGCCGWIAFLRLTQRIFFAFSHDELSEWLANGLGRPTVWTVSFISYPPTLNWAWTMLHTKEAFLCNSGTGRSCLSPTGTSTWTRSRPKRRWTSRRSRASWRSAANRDCPRARRPRKRAPWPTDSPTRPNTAELISSVSTATAKVAERPDESTPSQRVTSKAIKKRARMTRRRPTRQTNKQITNNRSSAFLLLYSCDFFASPFPLSLYLNSAKHIVCFLRYTR